MKELLQFFLEGAGIKGEGTISLQEWDAGLTQLGISSIPTNKLYKRWSDSVSKKRRGTLVDLGSATGARSSIPFAIEHPEMTVYLVDHFTNILLLRELEGDITQGVEAKHVHKVVSRIAGGSKTAFAMTQYFHERGVLNAYFLNQTITPTGKLPFKKCGVGYLSAWRAPNEFAAIALDQALYHQADTFWISHSDPERTKPDGRMYEGLKELLSIHGEAADLALRVGISLQDETAPPEGMPPISKFDYHNEAARNRARSLKGLVCLGEMHRASKAGYDMTLVSLTPPGRGNYNQPDFMVVGTKR